MSVTSGFFNSLNHDRRYNAQQMSAIFDGIINDGVFANIGTAFAITADGSVTINIGIGKAWFNSAWVYNDSPLPKMLEGSEVVLDRIDAVVIEVDHNESVRMGDIKIVKGTPSSSPKNPIMANETNKHQYPLCYIYRKAGSTGITQADITNMIGTSSCPYVTGILQVQNIDNIVAQWNGQWNQWYAMKTAETDIDASELMADMKSEFDIWFNDIQALLDADVATALAAQVAELQGKFDTLAREGAVYDTIEDADFDLILGSDGTPLQGKTVCGGGGNIDVGGLATKAELNNLGESKVNKVNVVNDFTIEEEGYVADARALKTLNETKLSKKLLWHNASVGSQFAEQTIKFDTNDYDELFIEYHRSSTVNRVNSVTVSTGNSGAINDTYPSGTASPICIMRTFECTADGIKFNNAFTQTTNSTTRKEDNTVVIPVRIYGIKGVTG